MIQTFELRTKTMADNALAIAKLLQSYPDKITRIRYPGLSDDPGFPAAVKQMEVGFGGMLAFDVGKTEK